MSSDLIKSIANEVLVLESQLKDYKALTERYESMKEQLKSAMEEAGVEKWELPNGTKLALVRDKADEEVVEKYFDEVAFMLDNKDLYDQYTSERTKLKKGRKGYVKITLPKEE